MHKSHLTSRLTASPAELRRRQSKAAELSKELNEMDKDANSEMNRDMQEAADGGAARAPEIELSVDGLKITVDPRQLAEEFVAMNETARAVKRMWLANLVARAKAEAVRGDAAYRAFRADATAAMLKKSDKIAEWKCRVAIESTPQFKEIKRDIAECEYNVACLAGLLDALALVPPAPAEPAY